MRFVFVICVLFLVSSTVETGSKCPQREAIYPCGCANVRGQYGVSTTVVQCHRLRDTHELGVILHAMKSTVSDAFQLYDSFWGLENEPEMKRLFPQDWLITLKSKTVEIVDTSLANCFACSQTFPCKNIETTKLVLRNSTAYSKFCSLCDTGRDNSYPWLNCMTNLKELHITDGKITTLEDEMFPMKIEALKNLKLSHNKISAISEKVFENMRNLTYLDLSHNLIMYLDGLFPSPLPLQILDVSWNSIEELGADFFSNLRSLKSFNIRNNHIVHLTKLHWIKPPPYLKIIDVSGNPIHCGCNITWLNTTFTKNIFFKGKCASPPYYKNRVVRYKANDLIKICNDKKEP